MPLRPVLTRKPFDKKRNIPRMSWAPENLYNVWLRASPESPIKRDLDFNRSVKTIFQQRWMSKRLTQGYHAEHIATKKFQRWFLPEQLPTVRHGDEAQQTSDLAKWVEGKEKAGGRTLTEKLMAENAEEARSPVGSLMWSEVERRLDVLIFRACFAASVWQARTYITQGHVKVNGYVVRNANVQLNPGDVFSIDPKVIPMINPKRAAAEGEAGGEEAAAEAKDEADAEVAEGVEAAAEAAEEGEAEATAEAVEEVAAEASESPAGPSTTAADGTYFRLPDYAQANIFVPAYILPSYLTCSAVYVRHPTARPDYSEIPTPFDADGPLQSLAWEWYQRVAPRMKPKRRARLMNPQRTQDRK